MHSNPHGQSPLRRTRRVTLLATVFFGAGALVETAALMPAAAAVIPNPVTSITVTPTNPRLIDPVRTDVAWCVPDSAVAGDTFTISLPAQLVQLPKGFNLRDPLGALVATATISGSPKVATFTFTDYIDSHVNVCGTAFFESRLDSTLVPGNSYTLTYVVNGSVTFQPVITITPSPAPQGRDTGKKGAFFGDPTDECRTSAQDCLGWFVESQVGPFKTITVSDNGLVDATFDCATLTTTLWTVNAAGNLVATVPPASVGATIQSTCTPAGFQVVGSNIPAGVLLRVLVRATPNALNPAGGVTFTNVASITHVRLNSTVDVDNVTGQRRSGLAGGDANGVQPPVTTTTVPATTVPATTVPAPTTTILAALPPTPPPPAELPATGTDGTAMAAGALLLLAGGTLLVASRRRRDHAV